MKKAVTLVFITLLTIYGCATYNLKKQSISQFDFFQIDNLDSIFYSKYEVSNKQYNEFLNSVVLKDSSTYNDLRIHNESWTIEYGNDYNKGHERNYHNHHYFNNFPVVNISCNAAKQYCEWLNKIDKSEFYYYRLPSAYEFNELVKTVKIKYDSDNVENYNEFNFNLKFEGNYAADGGMYAVDANLESDSSPFNYNIKQYTQNSMGALHIIGNVSEMLDNDFYTGGDWDTYPSETLLSKKYERPLPTLGFRVVKVMKKGNY